MKTTEIKNALKNIANNYANGDTKAASTALYKLAANCGKSILELVDFAEEKISKKCASNVFRAYTFRNYDRFALKAKCEAHTTTTEGLIHIIRTSLAAYKTNANNYTKVAILGNTGVYLASPVYRHDDYNKTRIADIAELPAKVIEIVSRY